MKISKPLTCAACQSSCSRNLVKVPRKQLYLKCCKREKELKNWDEAIRLLRRRVAICEDLGQEDNRQDSIRLIKVCQVSYEKEKQEAEKAALKQQMKNVGWTVTKTVMPWTLKHVRYCRGVERRKNHVCV